MGLQLLIELNTPLLSLSTCKNAGSTQTFLRTKRVETAKKGLHHIFDLRNVSGLVAGFQLSPSRTNPTITADDHDTCAL